MDNKMLYCEFVACYKTIEKSKVQWIRMHLPLASEMVILFISRTIGGNPSSSGSRIMSIVISPFDVAVAKFG